MPNGYGAVQQAILSDDQIKTQLKALLIRKKPDHTDSEFQKLFQQLKDRYSQKISSALDIITTIKSDIYEQQPEEINCALAIARANELVIQFEYFMKTKTPPLKQASRKHDIFACVSTEKDNDEGDEKSHLLRNYTQS